MSSSRNNSPVRASRAIPCLLLLVWTFTAEAHGPVHERLEQASRQIAADQQNAGLLVARAALYLEHADFAAALLDLARAGELNGARARIAVLRAKALSGQGQHIEALDVISALIIEDPVSAVRGYVVRAGILERLKRHDAAARDLAEAIRHVSRPDVDLFLRRARLLETCGDSAAALACLAEGRAALPGSTILSAALCDTAMRAGSFQQALQLSDELSSSTARKERWLARKAEALAGLGRDKEAREALRAALAAIASLPARHRTTPAMVTLELQLQKQLKGATPQKVD